MNAIQVSPAAIVGQLADLAFDDVFNPYTDVCPHHDLPDAPAIRRKNLELTLERAAQGVAEMWFALEPGHKGARRTGLAMTDDRRLTQHGKHWGIKGIERATKSGPETEITAGIVWEALTIRGVSAFLWNAFPLHSHKPGLPLSNRNHTLREREACEGVTRDIFELVAPNHFFAVGRAAESAMRALGLDAKYVRHPSNAGKPEFMKGIGAQ